jgi:hypothetical protein
VGRALVLLALAFVPALGMAIRGRGEGAPAAAAPVAAE